MRLRSLLEIDCIVWKEMERILGIEGEGVWLVAYLIICEKVSGGFSLRAGRKGAMIK